MRLERRQAHDGAAVDLARRSVFLAEASRSSRCSLDYEDTLAQAARVGVPEVADWAVSPCSSSGRAGRAPCFVTPSPSSRGAAARSWRGSRVDRSAELGAAQVIRTGQRDPPPPPTCW